jgi:hypothetical protein
MRALVPVLVLILATGGCGDGPAGLDDQQTITGNVIAFGTTEHAITTSRAGTLDVTLTWANPAIDLDLYLTGPQCTGYPPIDCTPLLASSDRFTGTSENIQRSVGSGEQFKVWVDNWDENLPSNYTLTVRVR